MTYSLFSVIAPAQGSTAVPSSAHPRVGRRRVRSSLTPCYLRRSETASKWLWIE